MRRAIARIFRRKGIDTIVDAANRSVHATSDSSIVLGRSRSAPTKISKITALGAGLLLFLLNAFICAKLATIEYLRAMHSIEGAYIGISRYVTENWGDLTWFPA